MNSDPPRCAPFQSYIELLRLFIAHREAVVESIESLLNAQRKPASYLRDQSLLSRHFENCFFARPVLTAGQTRLGRQLEQAHWAAGFQPRQVHYLHNDLFHPAELMIRAFHCWQQTRWPGRNGRLHYAHTLFHLYLVRCLAFLSMRVWDGDPRAAGGRLAELQNVLDELWKSSPAGQPAFVRDARWLIPLAQSLITDNLAPYFEVARQVAGTLPEPDRLEVSRAHVRMLGGHLTSQIRRYCTRDGLAVEDPSVAVRTRTSNALDLALLVQGLVELLRAYDRTLRSGDQHPVWSGDPRMRRALAGAIFQGISPDPELFLNRLGLLRPYSMMEHVFIAPRAAPEGRAVYSPAGERHVRLLEEYGALMGRLIEPLRQDFPRFRPVPGSFSPYGVIFGLPSNLIEHMALKTLERDAETRFSLEDVFDDVFDDENTGAAKLAWVNGWRRLPHVAPEAQRQYDYPQQFAEEIYSRIGQELRRDSAGSGTGRLYIVPGDNPDTDSKASSIPELPAGYFRSSDTQLVEARQAEPCDREQLLAERQEGHFLVSCETPGGWTALKKSLLTEVLAAGRDARITGLPPAAAQVLRLMCADLVAPENMADQTSAPPAIGKA
ncbi:MAG TPA: hypothetical protein VKV17_18020 [Bryobacteraceae bacterium]|nr:hypothetical protein [Bryobacteraceae bacterium]